MRLRDPCEFTAMAKKMVISQESWVSGNWKMLLIFIRHLYFLMRSRFIIFLGYFRTLLANRVFSLSCSLHTSLSFGPCAPIESGFLHIVEVVDAVSEGEARERGTASNL